MKYVLTILLALPLWAMATDPPHLTPQKGFPDIHPQYIGPDTAYENDVKLRKARFAADHPQPEHDTSWYGVAIGGAVLAVVVVAGAKMGKGK